VPSQCPKTEPSILGYNNETLKHLFGRVRSLVGVEKACDIDDVSTNHFYKPFILLPSMTGRDTILLSSLSLWRKIDLMISGNLKRKFMH
jgi:hypothetical protein